MSNQDIRVLVVEDLLSMGKMILGLLKQLEFVQVTLANDGNEAMKMLQEERFDVVLSDLYTDGVGGMEILKEIRSDADMKNTAVIFISDEKEKEIILQAIKAGVNGYIVKPLTANTLEEKIQAALSMYEEKRQLLSMASP